MVLQRRARFIIMIVALLFVLAGCGRPQAPAPGPELEQQQDGQQMTMQANQAVRVAEEKEGVTSAYAVMTGPSTLLVGVMLADDIQDDAADEIEESLTKEIPEQVPGVNRVMVTTDPDMVERVRDIGRGIAEGRPLSEFNDQIQEMTDRITPRT